MKIEVLLLFPILFLNVGCYCGVIYAPPEELPEPKIKLKIEDKNTIKNRRDIC